MSGSWFLSRRAVDSSIERGRREEYRGEGMI